MARVKNDSARPIREDIALTNHLAPRRHRAWFLTLLAAVALISGHAVTAFAQVSVEDVSGANGAGGTSSNPNGQAGASGPAVTFSVTEPSGGDDGGFQTIWLGAISDGGNGGGGYLPANKDGSPETDGNGNPEYDGTGSNAGTGGSVTLTNSGAVTANQGALYTPSTFSGTRGVFGQSIGGQAGQGSSPYNGGQGGNVSVTDSGAVNLIFGWGSNGELNQTVGVAAVSTGGQGSASYTGESHNTVYNGGNGNNPGTATVTVSGDVSLDETSLAKTPASGFVAAFPTPFRIIGGTQGFVGAAVVASSQGGNGGNGYDHSTGGSGGTAQNVTVTVTSPSISVTAATSNPPSGGGTIAGLMPAILAESIGGNGGNGGAGQNHSNGGLGGYTGEVPLNGGYAGTVLVNLPGDTTGLALSELITTNSLSSPGILAASVAGNGGNGTDYDEFNVAGAGGNGGNGPQAGAVTVEIGNGIQMSTIQAASEGVGVLSEGGYGGAGGSYGGGLAGDGGNGGSGGTSGVISIALGASDITTSGGGSPGVLALSVGAGGGVGGYSGDPADADGGNGGGGGGTGAVSVTVAAGGGVFTTGQVSPAIQVQSVGGLGGTAGDANSSITDPGEAGNGGSTGAVTVTNDGAVGTTNASSPGIIIQSITGGGGGGGSTGISIFYASGTSGGTAGSVGDITLTNNGSVVTDGISSAGIIAQSLGGAGGYGGGADQGIVSIGGSAGTGANGGQVTATSTGLVRTFGDSSPGLEVQSIGGGGGAAGEGSTGGVGIGGSGSTGGDGGQITVNTSGAISTVGANADAILAQSLGGGGGSAGSSDSFIAIGGSGSSSGNGQSVQITSTGDIGTLGSESSGIVAQSIGGGGGSGGDALQGLINIGGSAQSGGNGNGVTIDVGGSVQTAGSAADGVLAQSIGGGGGIGGNTSGIGISLGGSGTGSIGASGGAVSITSTGAVTTLGDNADAIFAQSIGGGGGIGGNATAIAPLVTVAVGGSAGTGGAPGTASVYADPGTVIQTYGNKAAGIYAQSIGGGGGSGGAGNALTGSLGLGVSIAVGGSGGSGGDGNTALASVTGARITTGLGVLAAVDPATLPDDSVLTPLPTEDYGVTALSTGGGGGSGGDSMAKSVVADLPIPETGQSIALSGSISVGGSGGTAGNGGPADVYLSNGTDITTYGNDSYGVYSSSTGGGGGDGGDASALAASFGFKTISKALGRDNWNFDLTVAVGGTGGAAGAGGPVSVVIGGTSSGPDDPATSQPVMVQTLGDYANAVNATSVGGGGGDAGLGSGSTQNGTSGATALRLSLTLGANGGGGGNGGSVDVTQYAGSTIMTAGDTALGISAMSVGGGGGASTGGSYQFGLPSLSTLSGAYDVLTGASGIDKSLSGRLLTLFGGSSNTVTINAGTDGAGGGNGSTVDVSSAGTVATTGEAATGIFAESIGGGGGDVGSAGSEASSDDPTVLQDGVALKKFGSNILGYAIDVFNFIKDSGQVGKGFLLNLKSLFPSVNFNLSFGAQGGGGGNGGPVTVTLNGADVSTVGAYADGIDAMSVGGGGAAGGAAVAGGSSGLGNLMKINLQLALGGQGGGGGQGGTVQVNLNGATINTSGYAAYGVFAQSLGGGGGKAGSAELNSSGYFTLGASDGGTSASGNAGNTVTLSQASGGVTLITTAGDAAHGIVAQSIGGGGGDAGQGFGLEAGVLTYGTTFSMTAGAKGSGGDGGQVTFDATNTLLLDVTTSGNSAYGIVAQSVGGGGGLAFQNPGSAGTYKMGGQNSAYAEGGAVTVQLRDGSSIQTSGVASIGILAQSVGGGGGIVGYPSGAPILYDAKPTDGPNAVTNGDGGAVTVATGVSTITTTGASAFGIFAQSVGAGGGLASGGDGVSWIAGTTGAMGSVGIGGPVTVTQNGSITANGLNAVGIFAQSVGQNGSGPGNGDGVGVTVNGAVQGGSGSQGWGVWVDTDYATNTVTVGQSGSVGSLAGQAIRSTGYGITNVDNLGTVDGTYNLIDSNATPGTFTNESTAMLVPAGTLGGNLVNAGLIAPSMSNHYATIPVIGDFQQTATGVYEPNAQFVSRQADELAVTGNATVAGLVKPVTQTILPRISVPILTVDGVATGELTAVPSTLFGYTVTAVDPPTPTGPVTNYYLANTSADFAPDGLRLTRLQEDVARNLQSIWDAGGSPAFGSFFETLDTLAGGNLHDYGATLGALAPQAIADYGARALSNLQGFADDLGRCDGPNGANDLVHDGQCAWFLVSGGSTSESQGHGADGFGLDQVSYAIGGEARVAPNWFVDGALSYQTNWLKTTGGAEKGSGQVGFGGAGARYQRDHWSVSADIFGDAGSYSTTRYLNVLGLQQVIDGSPSINSIGGRLAASYTFNWGSVFVRPRIALDGIYVSAPGFQESGSSLEVLNFQNSSQGTFAATPAIEFGKQVDLDSNLSLRMSLTTGVGLLSNSTWTEFSRFTGAPSGSADLSTTVPMDAVTGQVGVGVQLLKAGRYSLRAEYDGTFSQHTTVNGGAVAFQAAF